METKVKGNSMDIYYEKKNKKNPVYMESKEMSQKLSHSKITPINDDYLSRSNSNHLYSRSRGGGAYLAFEAL